MAVDYLQTARKGLVIMALKMDAKRAILSELVPLRIHLLIDTTDKQIESALSILDEEGKKNEAANSLVMASITGELRALNFMRDCLQKIITDLSQ